MREYRTYAHIAANYGLHEGPIVRCVRCSEVTLIKDGTFRLPGKKELLKQNTNYEVVLIDATETPIERPKSDKNFITPERKKRNTIKPQVIINKADSTVICTAFSSGRWHDFRLFKESKVRLNENIKVLADSAFQRIDKFRQNSKIPKKKIKKHPVTEAEKSNNHKISS